ncbi:hypothetical protein HELRODRAFT_173985 [Helobdella robusta]|uniref:G-patch domain-containing protein n=1 Tax=Helobdella robusta TaxID=6412 RepID=T1F7G2_HELRO|nr:hypothetical protein HELRODRAFT_173985 [Helobdella robusta]ESO03101.1 hypothetical protein HELRODRAFT_173985 [Helobdella robusta]
MTNEECDHRVPNNEIGSWEKHTKGIGHKLLEKMRHIPGRGLGKYLQDISNPVEAVLRKGRGDISYYDNKKHEKGGTNYFFEQNLQRNEKIKNWKTGDNKFKRSATQYYIKCELLETKNEK